MVCWSNTNENFSDFSHELPKNPKMLTSVSMYVSLFKNKYFYGSMVLLRLSSASLFLDQGYIYCHLQSDFITRLLQINNYKFVKINLTFMDLQRIKG